MNNRQIFALILLGVMVGLGYWVIKPFLAPVAWAGILAFVTWPVYRRLLHPLERHRSIAALIMTTLLIILLVVPVLWLLVRLHGELGDAYQTLAARLSDRPLALPHAVARIPLIGPALNDILTAYWNDPTLWKQQLNDWLEPWIREFRGNYRHASSWNLRRWPLRCSFFIVTEIKCWGRFAMACAKWSENRRTGISRPWGTRQAPWFPG